MKLEGDYLARVPNGGPFSLRQRCLWALRQYYVVKITEIVDKYTLSATEAVLEAIRYVS
jgi:hypothetical protein